MSNDNNATQYDYSIVDNGQLYVNATDRPQFSIPTSSDTSIYSPLEEQLRQLSRDMDKIKERLAILDDLTPENLEKLEKHKMLRDAYNKYKMIEALIGEDNETGSE